MTITVQRTISMGHRLPSYNGICSSPHGHNVRVEVEVVPLHEEDFLDFKQVDNTLAQILEPLDHAMVLFKEDPLLIVLSSMNFRVYSTDKEPTTEHLARHLFERFERFRFMRVRRVTVFETDKYSATVTR